MDYIRRAWSRLITFCSCLNCSENLSNQRCEPNERTHLLSAPISSNSPALRLTTSDNLSNELSHSLPKRDDQYALCRLVQNTAINMIDVGALDSHNLEHQEYNDRIKLYSQRLQQQWSNVQYPGKAQKGFLKDVSNPDLYLIEGIIVDDIIQIKNILMRTQPALMEIKINHKDAIVVPFRIP